ncbi:MAG: prepilin peptidase [Minisyncoccia bacterium]
MVEIILSVILFLIGLGVGSFINVITTRFQPDSHIKFSQLVSGRSRCPFCFHQLKWYDLIPIFSFVFLRGKCRYCKNKISYQYPIVEFLTAVIFLGLFLKIYNLTPVRLALAQQIYSWPVILLLSFAIYLSILIILSIIDLKYYLLPDNYILFGVVLAFLFNAFFYWINQNPHNNFFTCGINFLGSYIDYFNCQIPFWLSPILGAIFTSGFLFLIYLFSRGKGMGFGDVKLGIFIGLILGLTNSILALVIAFIFGSIAGIILLVAKKRTLKSMVPFGPFLALGVLITIFFGSNLIDLYLALFNIF